MAKPIKVWMAPPGPNPWKVVLILEELDIPYEIVSFKFDDVKKKPFIDLNPNGRVPAIEDPNTGLTLWESGAIIQYLIEQYDTEKKLTYGDVIKKNQLNQWLMFQMSGQGPYFGQAGWFNVLHSEKIPSAIERYNTEVKRILSVLEGQLEGKQWLVGDKITFADLSFVTWNDRIDATLMCAPEKKFDGIPNVKAWHERMTSRPSWKKAMETRAKLMDEQGLQWNGMPKGINNMEEYEAKIKADAEARANGEAVG
ncbi:glutathione S-transferase II [Lindgomyces ingoldianus]|uniref:Glutathione S-transferase II n=1 Tax=Lindgomyces ingoldianus TaxID=673940 RepID=A0ACB6RG53_9PLEO|nr:glutathione S-transferase II [Lindgomyces ingoldianus]KAF2478186.1 glutathione S-transferase II [Lindgomyces ingoldianus]